jgi:predicted O-methyltransferase YrrM
MKPLENFYNPIRTYSKNAANLFRDKSLDFVFIDASHEYEDVRDDILSWLPKVKEGGVIAGHDYYPYDYNYFQGVKKAVNEILGGQELKYSESCWIYYL